MRIVITGAQGRLGAALMAQLAAASDAPTVIPADAAEFDVTDYRAARAFIQRAAPDWVIHCAAWTDVDGCARDPERALRVNGLGAGNIAAAAAAVGAGIVHVSTNEVFSGESDRPYHEYDAPAPINPYGASKWAGEQAVMRVAPRHIIARTSWLFAHGGRNFAHVVLNAGREGRALRVVHDEIACPTYTDDLAEGLLRLIAADRPGTYHLVNDGACSRYELALTILERAGLDVPVTPIPAREWQRASTPPRFSPLANHAAALLGVTLRRWEAAVDAFLLREGLLTP
jgi:dTDP-4-dehydrorhamnose reductase